MRLIQVSSIYRLVVVATAIALSAPTTLCLQSTGALRITVADERDALIAKATVRVEDQNGKERPAVEKTDGRYLAEGLTPGKYKVRVQATGFLPYENNEVMVSSTENDALDVHLVVQGSQENVNVSDNSTTVNVESDNNAGRTVLRGADLDVLSDDPDQLASDLRMLAGPADGPNGNEFIVDGFSGGRLPSKSSIREVRINANPYTAEQEFFGFGRIEVFTKPGASEFHGETFFNYNGTGLNARNPFALDPTPFQSRLYGASINGPVFGKKGSYFFDFERREIDDSAAVKATTLDSALNQVDFRNVFPIPNRRNYIGTRFDYQLNKNNTLVARYDFSNSSQTVGLVELTLPSRAYQISNEDHVLQLTETAVLSPSLLNEFRFQYKRSIVDRFGSNSDPAILVQGAFMGGGSQIGSSVKTANSFEVNDITTLAKGAHTWKAGVRIRYVGISDLAPINFGGTYTFASLDQYRNVLLGVPGAVPAQFSIAGGDPRARVSQFDFGGFVQDDWHVRSGLTLAAGLRYDVQTNVNDKLNFAPRFSFAWAPGAFSNKKDPKTVIRGGFGIFNARFDEGLTLDANRYNGSTQQQYLINNPAFFPAIPSPQTLAGFAVPQTIRRVSDDISMPYSLGTSISIERQLPRNVTASIAYIYKRYMNFPLSLNINAPIPGTFDPNNPGSAVRPFGNVGNIFEFVSKGLTSDHTLVLTMNARPIKQLFMFGRLGYSRETGNNEGAYFFPSNSFDLGADNGRLASDRNIFGVMGASYRAPHAISLSGSIFGVSGNAFNITTGTDDNGDGIFNDRPAFATDLNKPGVILTPFGNFDPHPGPGQQIIPRNFGDGKPVLVVNMRLAKTFKLKFGGSHAPANQQGKGGGDRNYTMTAYIFAANAINHTSYGNVVGVLTSPDFGRPTTIVNTPRRIEVGLRFNF